MIDLPWPAPPLTLNKRMHWRTHGQWTRVLRQVAFFLARQAGIPRLERCSVLLVWAPPDGRRRDADNIVASLKPLCDGLVDAGVVADDTPALMVKPMPELAEPSRPPRLWLVVSELPPVERGCEA